jgi:hypothetical protein
MPLNLREIDAAVLEPRVVALNHNDHFVELYEDDADLVDSVRTFLSIGINEGEAAVVIAGASHRTAIEAALERTLDLAEARDRGVFRSLDAAETLARFMVGDDVDTGRFEDVIGDVLRGAASGGRRVRVFGEMVALLWEQGNVQGAVNLEDGWNTLAARYDFRLFCAYPATHLAAADPASLTDVCNRHSHVVVPPR